MDTVLYSKLDTLADDTLPLIFERNKLKKLRLNADKYQSSIDTNLTELKQGITLLSEQQSTQEQTGAKDTKIGEDQLIELEKKVDKLHSLLIQREDRELTTHARFTAVEIHDNGDILQLQQRIMDDQDQDLDQLTAVIHRQQELGALIGEELESHAQLIEETEDMVDRSEERLRQVKKKLHQINQRLKNHKSICIVIALILLCLILIGLKNVT